MDWLSLSRTLNSLHGKEFLKVSGARFLGLPDDDFRYESISLHLDRKIISLVVDADNDEILISLLDDHLITDKKCYVQIPALEKFVGKKISWMWSCTSWLGYRDAILISFGEFFPDVIIVSSGSAIEVFSVEQESREFRGHYTN